jgi:hypothetical protein
MAAAWRSENMAAAAWRKRRKKASAISIKRRGHQRHGGNKQSGTGDVSGSIVRGGAGGSGGGLGGDIAAWRRQTAALIALRRFFFFFFFSFIASIASRHHNNARSENLSTARAARLAASATPSRKLRAIALAPKRSPVAALARA